MIKIIQNPWYIPPQNYHGNHGKKCPLKAAAKHRESARARHPGEVTT